MRLRGVAGGLRSTGPLRSCAGGGVSLPRVSQGFGGRYFSRCRASVFSILEAMIRRELWLVVVVVEGVWGRRCALAGACRA